MPMPVVLPAVLWVSAVRFTAAFLPADGEGTLPHTHEIYKIFIHPQLTGFVTGRAVTGCAGAGEPAGIIPGVSGMI